MASCSVLWHSAGGGGARSALAQRGYASCPAVATSDHVPVYAAFALSLPREDAAKAEQE